LATPAPVVPLVGQAELSPVSSIAEGDGMPLEGSLDPLELSTVPGLDFMETRPFKLRKADANILLDMVQGMTGWVILRRSTDLPQMEINFNSEDPLTKGDTIRVIESLLSMHGIGIIKLGTSFTRL
jgi:hypothetical protein